MSRLPRRDAIARSGVTLSIPGRIKAVTETTNSATDPAGGRETEFPSCVYQPDDEGRWTVTMPINMHVAVPGDRDAVAAIEAEFAGLENPRWTQVFPDTAVRAWDTDSQALVAPDYSVRRPRLGDEWTHVHAWRVDADRVAVHAHLDVLDREFEYYHRGDHYEAATRRVRSHLSGTEWRRETPYSIDYRTDAETRTAWGETGDTKLEYVGD